MENYHPQSKPETSVFACVNKNSNISVTTYNVSNISQISLYPFSIGN